MSSDYMRHHDSAPAARAKVVVSVDHDNFFTNCAGRGMDLRAEALKELCREQGRPIVSAVFADTKNLSDAERADFFQHGFDIIDCPRLGASPRAIGKDLVDAKMTSWMRTQAEHLDFDILLLASADRDFLLEIQFVRDTGRKVFIVVPTANDRPEVSGLADGVVVYDRHFYGQDSALCRVAALFERREFQTTDKDMLREMVTLREMVDVLLRDIGVNENQFGFHATLRKVVSGMESRRFSLDPAEARMLLSFLVTQGVVERQQVQVESGAAGGTANSNHGPVCYRVVENHPFVGLNLHVLKEMAGLLFSA
ncbi:NYN domain-containing protein [Patescibacteria group bacterium]|nr:NYN domain-containing protein [Patescibacteria group bacterium]